MEGFQTIQNIDVKIITIRITRFKFSHYISNLFYMFDQLHRYYIVTRGFYSVMHLLNSEAFLVHRNTASQFVLSVRIV